MTKSKTIGAAGLKLSILSTLLAAAPLTYAADSNFIVNCKADCGPLIQKVGELGGTVSKKYNNVNAISVSMDSDLRSQLGQVMPAAVITKDKIFSLPAPSENVAVASATDLELITDPTQVQKLATERLNGFEFNNLITGASALNAAGVTGDGAIVAVIDSGTANNPDVVASLAGSVLGGENFVPGEGEPSATSTLNGSHGTNTASLIAGHTFFFFDSASTFAQSVATHMPESILYDFIPGLSAIPMFGSAPDSKVYAMKVFPAAGGGAPESRIIEAMDRVITLKTNYDNGVPSVPVNEGCGAEDDPCVYDSMNITVVNMSLGGGTLFAAQDLEDTLTRKMLAAGITLVASAGNEGHAAITGGSPGTGAGSLTVGAASMVGNERVLRDLQFGLGFGELYRPSTHPQMATFSSRGPSTDGRISTDIVANGFASLVQGPTGGLNVVSGTSFSAPSVAGLAALLSAEFPNAPTAAIRNSLVQSANPDILGSNAGPIDQGEGFADAIGAYNLLATKNVDREIKRGAMSSSVKRNITKVGMDVISMGKGSATVHKSTSDLTPGQVAHFFIESKQETDQLTINISNVVAQLDPAEQNLFFGDDIYFVLQDAITHTEATIDSGFISGDYTITVDNPQTGILRLALMGDWTNAGNISADVSVSSEIATSLAKSVQGKVEQNEQQVVEFYVPDGLTQVVFELAWKNNWGAYPTDDIDLFLLDPSFGVNFDGATFSSPERVVIDNPQAGVWTGIIQGYTVHGVNHGPASPWAMRVKDQDGNLIKSL